jgi:hypothetical protein
MRPLLLAVPTLAVLAAAALAQDGRYTDPGGRFALTPAPGWQVRATPAGALATAPDGSASFAVTPTATGAEVPLRDLADGYLEMVRNARPGIPVTVLADTPRPVGGAAGHRRTLRVGEDERSAVFLDAVFVRADRGGLILSGSCAFAARAAHEPLFTAMVDSVGAAPAAAGGGGDAARAGLEQKLRALDAARDAGVLTAAEHAQKRAAIEAELRALQPARDPELERRLEALDAARAAGILDAAEYGRKRAELLAGSAAPPAAGEAAPTAGAGAEPPLPAGRKGQTYRHPIGFSFWHPDGWKVTEHEDFLQLEPTAPAMEDGSPLELYFIVGDTVEGTGITRADDPKVLSYLDEQVKSLAPALARSGPPRPTETAHGHGCVVDWRCKLPDGRDLLARCHVTIVQQHGVSLLALGLPDRIAPREDELRAMFRSFGFGEGERDPALVGSWELVATSSIRNDSPFETDWSRARAVGESKSRLTLGADGRFERVDEWHMIALGAGVGLESKDRKVDRGQWRAGGGTVYLISDDRTWSDYRYELRQGQAGAELRTATGDKGQVWRRIR